MIQESSEESLKYAQENNKIMRKGRETEDYDACDRRRWNDDLRVKQYT